VFLVVQKIGMKYLIRFCLISTFFFSCKKDSQPIASQAITGTLRYSSPISDGVGLYFETDENESLLFKNEFSDYNTQYLHYIDFVDVHSRLTFIDRGRNRLFIWYASLCATASDAFGGSCETGERIILKLKA
jgi:hypothetical protein